MKKLPVVRAVVGTLAALATIISLGTLPALADTIPVRYEVLKGNTLEIKIPRGNNTYIAGDFEGQSILFQKEKEYFTGFLGINRLSKTETKDLTISLFTPGIGSEKFSIPVTIQNRNFATKYFRLPTSTRKLFGKNYQDPTWNLIYGSMSDPVKEQLWNDAFIVPTTGKITLGFGDKLYINKKYSGSHFGIDYANKKDTPVYAANSGIVKLASNTPAYGNVIVIDHGLNIFSMYLHLNSLDVKAGDKITRGDLIGKMGSTGLSNGDHLHFTMFVDKTIVDPAQWIGKL